MLQLYRVSFQSFGDYINSVSIFVSGLAGGLAESFTITMFCNVTPLGVRNAVDFASGECGL